MKKYCLLVLILFHFSCTSWQTQKTLHSIDHYLHEYPDSAWNELGKIGQDRLTTRHLRAYHALLYSLASDKTYHDYSNDSIARVAVDYYDSKGSDRYRMLAWYSLGRVQINAQQWTSAIVSLTEALSAEEIIGDSFYAGLIHKNLAFVYRGVYDNNHALIEIEKAISSFDTAGKKQYQDYSLFDKMIYLYGNRKGEEALNLAEALMSDTSIDSFLRGMVILNQARILSSMNLHSDESVLEKYKKVLDYPDISLTPLDYSNIAYSYSLNGLRDSVTYYLELAERLSTTKQTEAEVSFNKYKIAKRDLPSQEAVDCFAKTMYYEDSLIHVKLNNSVSYALNEYQSQKLKTKSIESDNQRLALLSTVLLAVIVIIVSAIWYRKSRRDLNEAIEIAAGLKDNLAVLENYRNRLQTLVINQYRDRLNELSYLSSSYLFWETDNFKKEQKKGEFSTEGEILDKFRSQLRELRKNSGILVKMEEEVDACNEYLISRLRQDTSRISEKGKQIDETDFLLLTLFLSGFDNRQVAFLSNIDYDVVRKRKSRLWIKLDQLGTPAAVDLLTLLGRGKR